MNETVKKQKTENLYTQIYNMHVYRIFIHNSEQPRITIVKQTRNHYHFSS